jgi:O-antigen/teichoic acid export membrane protein
VRATRNCERRIDLSDTIDERPWSSLKHDTAAFGIAVFIDRLTGFLLLPLLTAAMDRTTFGAWAQVLTALALMSTLLEFGFYHAIVRYVPGAPRGKKGRVLHGMLLVFGFNSAVFLLLAWLVPGIISRLLFATPASANVILAAAAFIIAECLFEFLVLAFLRADGQIRAGAIYYAVKSVLRVALLWQGLWSGADLTGLFLRVTAGDLVLVVLAYAVHIAPSAEIAVSGLGRKFWREVFHYAGAIVLSSVLSWANSSLNRFRNVYVLGLAALGLYAANYSIAAIVTLASLVMNFTAVPHLNNAWNRGEKARVRQLLATVVEYYCYLTIPVAVAIAVFYLPLARLLTSEQYLADPALIYLLVTFMVLVGLEQLLTFATFLDNSRFSAAVSSVSLAVNVVLCLALLGVLGIVGAAVAVVISTLLVVTCNAIFLRRMVRFAVPWQGIAWIAGASLAFGVAAAEILKLLGPPTLANAVVAGIAGLPVFLGLEALRGGSVTRQVFETLVTFLRTRTL